MVRFLAALFLFAASIVGGVSGIVLGTALGSVFSGSHNVEFLPFAAVFAGSVLAVGIVLIDVLRIAVKGLIHLAIFFGACLFSGIVLETNILQTGYLLILILGTLIASGLFAWRKLASTSGARSEQSP